MKTPLLRAIVYCYISVKCPMFRCDNGLSAFLYCTNQDKEHKKKLRGKQ